MRFVWFNLMPWPRSRLSGWHLDGHQLRLRPGAGSAARALRRGARAHSPGLGRGRAVCLQWPLHKTAVCQLLAEAYPAASSADLHTRRRLDRDLGFLHREQLQLFLSELFRLSAGVQADEGYWQRVAQLGADASPYRATFAQIICVAETDLEAERLYGPHVSYFFNRCLHVFPGFVEAPGYRTVKTIQAEFLRQLARPNLGQGASLSWKELVELGYIVAGSPETVRQRMEELIKTLRVGNIICGIHVGDMPPDKTRHSTELFARNVMPHLKGIWKDYDSDERFWIHPLPKRTVGETAR